MQYLFGNTPTNFTNYADYHRSCYSVLNYIKLSLSVVFN